MADWIEHVQRFVVSNFKDQAAWDAAMTTCKNPQIREFFRDLPITDEDSANRADLLAESLRADGQEVPALMVRFLTDIPILFSLESPLQVPHAHRKSLLGFALRHARQIGRHQELLVLSGILNFMRGNALYTFQDYPAARIAFEESCGNFRQLATKKSPIYQRHVADNLHNLGMLLLDERDYLSAHPLIEEALTIRRHLAVKDPLVHLPGVATTLISLGNLMHKVSNFPATQNAYNGALEIYRDLATKQPTSYQPYVASTLSNLGIFFHDERNFFSARRAFEEALGIYDQLADARLVVHQLNVAALFNNYGVLLRDMRVFSKARRAFEEALVICRRLASEQPETYLLEVISPLNNLGNLLRDIRDFPAARRAFEEAADIYRQIPKEYLTPYLPGMAGTLSNLGNVQHDQQDFSAALMTLEDALTIRHQLAGEQPTSYRLYEVDSLNNLGNLLRSTRDFLAARRLFEEAVDISRQLAAQQRTTNFTRLALSLNNLGSVQRNERDFSAARRTIIEALDIYRQLVPKHPYYQQDMAMILNNLGMVLYDKGDFLAAHANCEEAVKLAETMELSGNARHLVKNTVSGAYQFLVKQATDCSANDKAFAYSVAMRDGQARSGSIGLNELQETQAWLKQQTEQYGMPHRLLVANRGSGEQLVLGLIDQTECRFVALQSEAWIDLFPGDKDIEDHEPRRQLARELWKSLPDAFQVALTPVQTGKPFIMISGDPLWSAFPWELLRFGDGGEDYLGLHHALPRISAIQAKDLELQLNSCGLGQGGGQMAILAPYDTNPCKPLDGVVDEIKSVMKAVKTRGGRVVAFARRKKASDLELIRQINLQPDIFHYSGHGAIVQDEELLILHRDKSEQHALTPITYFGKAHLMSLAEQQGGQLFPQRPLIVLNSCLTGRARQAGGAREDLISTFLTLGAGAVIASEQLIYDSIGKALGEALFDPEIASTSDIGSVIVGARRRLAREVRDDVESLYWGEWALIHLHGNARATLPFKQPPVTP